MIGSFNPEMPYNDLPVLPPKQDIETKSVLKKAISANRALAQLRGVANLIPNPEILINSITLQEAKASSEIENIVTTNDELFKAFAAKSENFDSNTKEVIRYREALWEGFNKLKSRSILTTNLFVNIYQKIKDTDAGIRNTPGTYLTGDRGKIVYTPPEGENQIRELLLNLEKFIHNESDGIDPLIKAALIHYQFEAIHPFTDGNGRTGRIILVLYFVFLNYLDIPIIYLSKYIIENKSNYYRLLRGVTENNEWEPWILFILEGIESTSTKTISLINAINQSMQDTINNVRALRKLKVPKEVLELIYEQPYCKTEFIIQKEIAKRKAAERYLKELVRLNILKTEKIGKEVVYINILLFDILSGY